MEKWIETTGRTEEDAISAALFQLGLQRDDVSVEVVERAKSGFLGFGSNPAKVRVHYEDDNGTPRPLRDPFEEDLFSAVKGQPGEREPAQAPVAEKKEEAPRAEEAAVREEAPKEAAPVEEETILAAKPGWQPAKPRGEGARPRRERPAKKERPAREAVQEGDEILIGSAPVEEEALAPAPEGDEKAERIASFLTGLLERLEVEAVPQVFVNGEGAYKVVLQGKDLGSIIGRRGETLDAIQQLTSYCVNRSQSKRVRIHVDAEGYRAKREESLRRLAVKVAGKVVRYRKNMTLEPMNAYERHVIHTALQDVPGVTTYSTGTEPNRRVIVAWDREKK